MRTLTNVSVLDYWDGPYRLDEISRFKDGPDYGVYQIYGTHSVLGPDIPLYIGRAEKNSFSERIPAHQEWIQWEPSMANIYIGRLVGTDEMTNARWAEWEEMIRRTEALLIYFCSPPYNSSGIKTLAEYPATIVFNFKRRHRLPLMVSNIYETAPFGDPNFRPYGS
jgi:hypothetical protein